MWNNLSVSIEKRKFVFAGLLVIVFLVVGTGKAFAAFPALDYQGGWWGPDHNNISNNAYMQHVVSRDGYTDIFNSKLKIYSRDSRITVEIFGADLCTNQPSYTTDEFFTTSSSARSDMAVSYRVGPATDIVGQIGVEVIGATPATVSTSGSYKGSSCTSANARRVVTARSNIYDETLGRYVYSFVASAGSQSGYVNGFRVRALGVVNTYDGMLISPEAASGGGGLAVAQAFGIEAGYPRGDNNNPGANSTYTNFSYPFVPNCGLTAPGASTITMYDDDNANTSIQTSTKFSVRVLRTDVSPYQVIPFTSITLPSGGSATGADSNGYRTVTTPDTSYSYLNFNMVATGTYRFDVRNFFQNNTLQISLPGIASSSERNCPQPATLDGVKMDSNFGATVYGGNTTGAFSGMNTTVAGKSDAGNPFNFTGTKSIPVTDFDGKSYNVRLANAVPAGWQMRGYKICGSNSASCNNAWLADANNIIVPSKNSSGFFNFNYNFLPGVQYHMRWIFMPTVAINCAQPPIFSPADPDTQTDFSFRAGVEFGTYTPVSPRISLSILNAAKQPLVPVRNYASQNLAPGTDETVFSGIARMVTGGDYWFRWTYQDSIQTVTCEHRQSFGFQPFVSVVGGDFFAGGKTDGTKSGVQSWNRNNNGNPPGAWADYIGAGSTHAILASGEIKYFSTARKVELGAWYPDTLAFSNMGAAVNEANGLYGGGFEAVPLRTDFYEQANDQMDVTDEAGSVADVSTLSSGIHRYAGDITLYGTVPAGRDVTVITNGNVLISASAGPSVAYAPYASVAQIPRLNVYTQNGDIMVASGVTEIRGVYAAGRNFYSCAIESPLNAISYSELGVSANNTACYSTLKIYGSVQADELIFSRTAGSYRMAFAPPAEEIIYSPELWLGNSSSGGAGVVDLNSYIGLPPIL